MKKCYLDSNCLIYLKNDLSPFYLQAATIIRKLVADDTSFYISPLVIDEFLHGFAKELKVYKVKNVFPSLHKALSEILAIPLLQLVNPPLDMGKQLSIVKLMDEYNLRSRDAYHLLIMQSNDIDSFATFDTDFKKVFAAKLLVKA